MQRRRHKHTFEGYHIRRSDVEVHVDRDNVGTREIEVPLPGLGLRVAADNRRLLDVADVLANDGVPSTPDVLLLTTPTTGTATAPRRARLLGIDLLRRWLAEIEQR